VRGSNKKVRFIISHPIEGLSDVNGSGFPTLVLVLGGFPTWVLIPF